MNVFRCTPDRSLDRIYLRTCAVYRLLKHGRIDKAKAIELADRPLRPGSKRYPQFKSKGYLNGTIEIWLNGPLKHRKDAA
jgi:hypothetical protein